MTAALPDWNDALQPGERNRRSVENIVLPLDGTDLSRPAIPVARKLSQLYGATLHVAYVGEEALDPKQTPGHLGFSREEARGAVFDLVNANPVEVLGHSARKLPGVLIVMSTHTGRQTHVGRFGSVTESICATRPQRIVVLAPERGDKPWDVRRILLAHDGTPACHAATAPAAELAQHAGAEVIALHVAARGAERPGEPGSLPAPQYVDQPQHEWPAWGEEFMNRILATGAPPSSVRFKLVVTGGQAGSEVAQVARERDIDLVVMAWHGHWHHERCATRVVIRTSHCPVLLVYSAAE